jgi:capsular exopolysaccharide synthesis family protein
MIPGNKKAAFTLHDVLMYGAVAAKHTRLMVLLICFTLTAGLTYYVFAKPVFYSASLIQVDYLARPLDTEKIYEDGRLEAFLTQFTAPHILSRTARALGVDTGGRDLERKYLFRYRAYFNSEKNIQIEVWPWSADWAHRWTETMVQEFLAYRQEKRLADKNNIIAGYSEELKEVAAKLDEQFAEKLDFQDQHDFNRLVVLVNSIQNLPGELSQAQTRIDEMGRIRVRLQDPGLDAIAKLSLISSVDNKPDTQLSVGQTVATNRPGGNGPSDPSSPNYNVVVVPSLVKAMHPWDQLAQDQQQLRTRMQEATRIYLPGHRKMIEMQKQLDEINDRLNAELKVSESRFDLEFQELLNKKQDMESRLPQYQELARKHAKLLAQLQIFDLSRLPYEGYVANMKKQINEVEFAGEKERINIKYAGLLEVRDDPVSPNRLKLMLMSLLGGIALAIGVPFLIEYLDHTLSNLEQVEHSFRLRGLGIVPQTPTSDVLTLTADETKPHSLLENFRIIRSNVLSMGAMTKVPHVIMVTSAMPKEGKTVVSANLAASFALSGGKTLLIDTDLRRGRLHRLFGYRKEPGLSNVLLGEVTFDQACRQTPQENLHVLSAGRHLANGTELIGAPNFTELMQELRNRYDRIIIDTPPVLGLSETSIMQKSVDGVLFVIWTGHTPTRGVKTAIESLQASGANIYGFVLNRLDLNTTQNYYHYYYYSHDYYYHQALETT